MSHKENEQLIEDLGQFLSEHKRKFEDIQQHNRGYYIKKRAEEINWATADEDGTFEDDEDKIYIPDNLQEVVDIVKMNRKIKDKQSLHYLITGITKAKLEVEAKGLIPTADELINHLERKLYE